MAEIVTFGELMLRLQPYNYERFVQCERVAFGFGGSEANVAVSLAGFGRQVAHVTRLPAHAIGQAAVNSLRRYGVDTSLIVRGGERVGIYFNEKGAAQRGGLCIYDRANSAFWQARPDDFDWDRILEGASWFHFSGITPALGPDLAESCLAACRATRARGVKISLDTNYRSKLWSPDAAQKTMTTLAGYADVCITNGGDAATVLGVAPDADGRGGEGDGATAGMDDRATADGATAAGISDRATDATTAGAEDATYRALAKQLASRFGFEKVALTRRQSRSASDNGFSALLYDAASGECAFSRQYDLHIVDRVGGGDAFAAGLLYGLLCGKTTRQTVEFATAAAALKHSVEGDYNLVTVDEVEKLAAGDGTGRIQR